MRPSKAILAAKAASRANGSRGRGPVTEAGKRRSSLNAIRHGLLAKGIVLSNESEETFARLHAQHLAKLGPADDVEEGAVEEMVAASWRLRRLWAIETRLFDNSIAKRQDPDERDRLAGAFSDLAAGSNLHILDRHETRLHRMYQRSLQQFLLLREIQAASDGADGRGHDAGENFQTNLDSDKPC